MKKQLTVALSSTEAECRGASVTTYEGICLRRLLKDLQVQVSNPTTIFCDNISSIQLVKNPVYHTRTKHIEVHYHFACERVLSGEVKLMYVPTDRQSADIFTKPLVLNKLWQFSNALSLLHLDMPNLRGRKERNGRDRKAESTKSSISGRPKKSKTYMGGATEGKSRSRIQLNKGKITSRRTRRQRPRHGLLWSRA